MTNQLLAGVGKIARFDFPRTWPTLIDEIGCKLAVDDEEVKYKSLKLLHESTKELATKRIPADRKAFCDVGILIIVLYYVSFVTKFPCLSDVQQDILPRDHSFPRNFVFSSGWSSNG